MRYGGFFNGQRSNELQTRESELKRQKEYFLNLWLIRAFVCTDLLLIVPIVLGRMTGPIILMIVSIIYWLNTQKGIKIIVNKTFPRQGITWLELVFLFILGMILSIAGVTDALFGWRVWPAAIYWSFDFKNGMMIYKSYTRFLFDMFYYPDGIHTGGFLLWLRALIISISTVGAWVPFVLLDWRFRAETQGSNIPNVTFSSADPEGIGETPDGISYRNSGKNPRAFLDIPAVREENIPIDIQEILGD